jgi:FkbM family methyltransferase
VPYVSYSQNFEDYRLYRALSNIKNGAYIDIGAWEPQYHSVSYNFYQQGWRGLNVEPQKQSYEKLVTSRPEDININKFVTTKTEPIKFYNVLNSGLSSSNLGLVEQERIGKSKEIQLDIVETISLDKLFREIPNQTIQWLKIDVEGAETEVIESWGENPTRPWIVVVESTVPGSQIMSDKKWESAILSKGYIEAYFDGLNTFYALKEKQELALSLSEPISIFDSVYKSEDYFNREIVKAIADLTYQNLETSPIGYLDEPSFEIYAQEAYLIVKENINLKNQIERIQEHSLLQENAYSEMVNAKIFRFSYALRSMYYKLRKIRTETILRKMIIYLAFIVTRNTSRKKIVLKLISPRILYNLKKIIRNHRINQKTETDYQTTGLIDYKLNRLIKLNQGLISENNH